MNWPAYFQAAMEELDAFLANPKNAEWRDTMHARVAESILMGIAQCSIDGPPYEINEQATKLHILREACKAKAYAAEAEPCSPS